MTGQLLSPPEGQALAVVADAVDPVLRTFVTERCDELLQLHPALEPVTSSISSLVLDGGKRLRPAFLWWGHWTAADSPSLEVLKPAAAVELLHVFALIHDDVMDRSSTRRGMPAVHTALASHHTDSGMTGDPEWFGIGGGILAGDMTYVWADELFNRADLDPAVHARGRALFSTLRTEVMAGQYLDLRLGGLPHATENDSLDVSLLKSARYTVTRPLQIGAALAPHCDVGCEELHNVLGQYGDAVGVAFQLRDDVLGLMGDPEHMGKGHLEDVREGKRTLLILHASAVASPTQLEQIEQIVGNAEATYDDVDVIRQIIVETDSLNHVEAKIDRYVETAIEAIDGVSNNQPLLELITKTTQRTM